MIKKQFKARNGASFGDDLAQAYGLELYRLYKEKNTRIITPNDIVEDAKNPSTSYHSYFEWDNKVAAEKHRLQQARHLIDSIVELVLVGEGKEERHIRSFHNIVFEEKRGYAKVDMVFSDVDMSNQVIKKALNEARQWSERYESYRELSGIRTAIIETIKEIEEEPIPA